MKLEDLLVTHVHIVVDLFDMDGVQDTDDSRPFYNSDDENDTDGKFGFDIGQDCFHNCFPASSMWFLGAWLTTAALWSNLGIFVALRNRPPPLPAWTPPGTAGPAPGAPNKCRRATGNNRHPA